MRRRPRVERRRMKMSEDKICDSRPHTGTQFVGAYSEQKIKEWLKSRTYNYNLPRGINFAGRKISWMNDRSEGVDRNWRGYRSLLSHRLLLHGCRLEALKIHTISTKNSMKNSKWAASIDLITHIKLSRIFIRIPHTATAYQRDINIKRNPMVMNAAEKRNWNDNNEGELPRAHEPRHKTHKLKGKPFGISLRATQFRFIIIIIELRHANLPDLQFSFSWFLSEYNRRRSTWKSHGCRLSVLMFPSRRGPNNNK